MILHSADLMIDPFTDPAPWRPSGLQRARCACGATAYVDAEYAGIVRCGACWRAARGAYATGRPAPIPRGVSMPGARSRSAAVLPSAPAYVVLAPARPASGAELPAGARDLVVLANQHAHTVRATYALAEEREAGQLVHSLCVRVRAEVGAGYATWRNERFAMASWWPRDAFGRRVPLEGLRALLAGQPYAPRKVAVVKGPCPRCGREVRWTKEAVTWAHFRQDTGQRCA